MQLHAFVYFVFAALLTVSTVICKSSSGFEAEAELLERNEELAAKPKCRRLGQSSSLRGLGQCGSREEEESPSVPMMNLQPRLYFPRGEGEAVALTAEAGAPPGATPVRSTTEAVDWAAKAKEAYLEELQAWREKVRLCIHMDITYACVQFAHLYHNTSIY